MDTQKFNQGMKLLREKYQKNKAQKLNLINPTQRPRYDEVYQKGIEWLESLAGEPFAPPVKPYINVVSE
jgi:hypothetical protein